MLGDPFMRIKKGYITDKVIGVDRFKDIREGSPNKKGLVDYHKKSKTKSKTVLPRWLAQQHYLIGQARQNCLAHV